MSKNSDKSSKDSEMVTSEASALVAAAAGPRLWGDNRKNWLARAARRLGFSYQRTRSIFYGEARAIRAEEMDRLRAELNELEQGAAKRWESLNELDALIAQNRATAGSGAAGRGSEGAAADGGRGQGTSPSGVRAGEHAAAARKAQG